ncbi:MAG: hypothetical protein OEM02_07710 [Desulfobulbaceae bacterium]|nr:hypothetical protein [Desulfobulbaceae bacterium]
MHILGLLELAVQLFFAVHAGRTGRYWWIFLILGFPVAGSIIYFFAEYLPETQLQTKHTRVRRLSPAKRIKLLLRELEISESIQNKINLAEAYSQNGQYRQSIDLLEGCLVGAYSKDLHILEGLSFCFYNLGNFEKTLEYLSDLEEANEGKLSAKLRLMRATVYEKIGDDNRALEEYESIVNIFSGEEARCRYALLLKKRGQTRKAQELFEEIVRKAKLYPTQYKLQREWVKIAKKGLK